jgi:hypothetical protein
MYKNYTLIVLNTLKWGMSENVGKCCCDVTNSGELIGGGTNEIGFEGRSAGFPSI